MYAIADAVDCRKFRERRQQIESILKFLRDERLALERSQFAMHPAAFRQRLSLYDWLTGEYQLERASIDLALTGSEPSPLPQRYVG
jgi:hypothetical protein